MGLFGGSTTYVTSVAYNLAGDEADQPNYLKGLVSGNVITNSKFSIVDTIRSGYGNSPGQRLLGFFRWSVAHYATLGLPTSHTTQIVNVSPSVLMGVLPKDDPTATYSITQSYNGPADPEVWAVQYIQDHNQESRGNDYIVRYQDDPKLIIINWIDGSAEAYRSEFTPDNYSPGADYLFVTYTQTAAATTTTPNPQPRTRTWIYRFGSGIASLDALAVSTTFDGFYPSICIRNNNAFVPDGNALKLVLRKAYKKATGSDYDDLVNMVAQNSNLSDIDYAFVYFGVALNSTQNSCRKYLYKFFTGLMNNDLGETGNTSTNIAYYASVAAWETWVFAQRDPSNPLYGAAAPAIAYTPGSGESSIRLRNTTSLYASMDVLLFWSSISESFGTGSAKAGASAGDVWLTPLGGSEENQVFSITWQVGSNNWRRLVVQGFYYDNYVYNGKAVRFFPNDVLTDQSEKGLIVPLHYGTMRKLSIVDSTQMSTASQWIVFNCYKTVKKKWYQTGFFKLVAIIAIIAISIAFPPAGGAGAGLLGSAAAVGAAVGLTGLLAIIVGTIANLVAALIVSALIQTASTALFGDKLGALIGAIVTVVAMQVGTSLMNGGTLATAWSGMMTAPNLIHLTESVGGGISQYMQASAQGTLTKLSAMETDFAKQSEQISKLYAQNIGYDTGSINTLGLTDVSFGNLTESPSAFLTRTLMTGSDIAAMSMNMLSEFADLTLRTDLRLAD